MHGKSNFVAALLFALTCIATSHAQERLCPFDSGDTDALARCLLRPVLRGGNLGRTPATLPAPLGSLVGRTVGVDVDRLRDYLRAHGIAEGDVGGALARDLSRVRFFVIHDTSSPEISAASFPSNIDEPTWPANNLRNWLRSNVPTHVFVNRVGESGTKANFNVVVRGTKYELGRDQPSGQRRNRAVAARGGLFVHIENIQPRRRSRPGTFFDLGPEPGFSRTQLDRLALLYVAASVRAGRWLLPAFHCALDTPIPDAHDDPQSFDTGVWLESLSALLSELGQTADAPRESSTPTGDARPSATPAAPDEFNFPEPTDATRGRRLTLWATFYHVAVANRLEGGRPLLAPDGTSLGVSLSARDWCKAAMEGTVSVVDGAAPVGTFNFAGRGASRQVDCATFYPHVPADKQKALGRARFETAKGPFGTGVRGMILVPYRTIAVDGSQTPIPYGTVVYVPEARGRDVTLPSGRAVKHDGYFFAADTGGLIKGNHVDVFAGMSDRNPFPGFVKSADTGTFTAFVVNDASIADALDRAHSNAR